MQCGWMEGKLEFNYFLAVKTVDTAQLLDEYTVVQSYHQGIIGIE